MANPATGWNVQENIMIRSYTFEEYVNRATLFHGYAAPGVIIGGFMVDLAYKHLPHDGLFDALCETAKCLPDAIQLLTPCTLGNGWLKVVHLGHFALALYDKQTGEGVRVGIDYQRLEPFTEIKSWLCKLKPKEKRDETVLLEELQTAGPWILTTRPVNVNVENLRLPKKKGIVFCTSCGEAYPAEYGSTCMGCQGMGPYLNWPL